MPEETPCLIIPGTGRVKLQGNKDYLDRKYLSSAKTIILVIFFKFGGARDSVQKNIITLM
jgi:hypothetical protein